MARWVTATHCRVTGCDTNSRAEKLFLGLIETVFSGGDKFPTPLSLNRTTVSIRRCSLPSAAAVVVGAQR